MLKNGDLSACHARAILPLEDEDAMIELAGRVVARGLSVREVENAVKRIKEREEEEDDDEPKAVSQVKVQ